MLLAVASQVSAQDFGRFSLVYAVYVVGVGLSRALCSEPLVVLTSGGERDDQLISGSLSSALIAGCLVSVPASVAVIVLDQMPLLAFAFFLPGLLLQDALRVVQLSLGTPGKALAIDSLWTGFLCVFLAVLLYAGSESLTLYVTAWGFTGLLSSLLGLKFAMLLPSLSGLRLYTAKAGPMGRRYAGEFASGSGSLQIVHFAIAAFIGALGIGALRAAQTLLGPFNQLLTGFTVAFMPEFVRIGSRAPERLLRASLIVSGIGTAVVLVGTVVVVRLPEYLGIRLLGDSWAGAEPLLLPAGITIAGNMAILGPLLGLRALALPSASLTARTTGSILTLLAAMTALILGATLLTVVWTVCASVWVGGVIWWVVYLRQPLLFRPSRRMVEML